MPNEFNPHVGAPLGSFPVIEGESTDCNSEGIPADEFLELATSAQSITVDGQSVTERSMDEIIQADKYIKERNARCSNRGNGWASIGVARAVPPDGSGRN